MSLAATGGYKVGSDKRTKLGKSDVNVCIVIKGPFFEKRLKSVKPAFKPTQSDNSTNINCSQLQNSNFSDFWTTNQAALMQQ